MCKEDAYSSVGSTPPISKDSDVTVSKAVHDAVRPRQALRSAGASVPAEVCRVKR